MKKEVLKRFKKLFEEQKAIIKQQILDSVAWLDERRGIIHTRRHLASTPVFKGIPNFKETRIAMLRADDLEAVDHQAPDDVSEVRRVVDHLALDDLACERQSGTVAEHAVGRGARRGGTPRDRGPPCSPPRGWKGWR